MELSAADCLTTATVLLVDDDPLIGEIVSQTLGDVKLDVIVVDNGDDAMDTAWRVRPDLVILDCALPGRPGMVLLNDFRRSPMFENVPILMLTGRRSDWHEKLALKNGANGYLRKPFGESDLVIAISRLLRQQCNV